MKESIDNLQQSYNLSSQQIADAVNPLEVVSIFEQEQFSYVLIGGHMLSFYTGTARATVDVDFIIDGRDFPRAVKAINKAYTQFKHHDRVYHVTYDTQQNDQKAPERIDLVKDGFPLFREIVKKHSYTLSEGAYTIKLPELEAAITLKFAASISPNRSDEKKSIDHADLLRLVRLRSYLDNSA